MAVIINIMLLAVLFVAGLVNLFIYLPTKRISAWFKSFSFAAAMPTTAEGGQEKPTQKRVESKERAAAAAACIAGKEKPPTKERVELQKVFGTFDKNDDGYITKEELMESLANIRISMTKKEVEEMFEEVDGNGDGLIDFEEFCGLGERMMVGKGREEEDEEEEEGLKEAFAVFDKDKDGLISVEELGVVLSCLGMKEGRKVEDCREMIRKVDRDGDGMVNFDEFKRMMRGGVGLILAQS